VAWFEPLVLHAHNPRWPGPLCEYEVAAGLRPNRRPPVFADTMEGVTCKRCLRRLGKLPKQPMPGQAWIMKKKREMFGGAS